MGMITIVSMKKKLKIVNAIIIILIIYIIKLPLINLGNNIFKIKNNLDKGINYTLQEENIYLKQQLNDLGQLNTFTNYKYSISHILYKESYNTCTYLIEGGYDKKYKYDNLIMNNDGLVGIIKEVYKDTSLVKDLRCINNLSISINNNYGTISKYQDNYLIVENLSNYDDININDIVYTSKYNKVNKSIKLGTVYKKEYNNEKITVYIKPYVDFNNTNYFLVLGVD